MLNNVNHTNHEQCLVTAPEDDRFKVMTTMLRRSEVLTAQLPKGQTHPFDVGAWKVIDAMTDEQRETIGKSTSTMNYSGTEVTYDG